MKTVSIDEATAQLPSLAQMVIDGETVLLSTTGGEIIMMAKSRFATGIDDYDDEEIAWQNAVCATVEPRAEM